MNTISRDNNMQGVGTAYRVDKARKTTEITNNQVNTKLSGMEFNQNAGTLRFWVIGHDITFGTLAEPIPAPLCSGILVADGNISMLSYPLAKTGINLLAATGAGHWDIARYRNSGLGAGAGLGTGPAHPTGHGSAQR